MEESEFYIIEVKYYSTAGSWKVMGCEPHRGVLREALAVTWSVPLQRVWIPSRKALKKGCWVSPHTELKKSWESYTTSKRDAILAWSEFMKIHPKESAYYAGLFT